MNTLFKVFQLCRSLDCEAAIDGDAKIAFLVDVDTQMPIGAVCLLTGAVVYGKGF